MSTKTCRYCHKRTATGTEKHDLYRRSSVVAAGPDGGLVCSICAARAAEKELVEKALDIIARHELGREMDYEFDAGESGDVESHRMQENALCALAADYEVSREYLEQAIDRHWANQAEAE